MKPYTWVPAGLVILLSLILRLYSLDAPSIWGDEACMVNLTRQSPVQILDALMSADRPDVDVAPPLYFLSLHAWQIALGASVSDFRAFSVIWGVLAVIGTMILARRISDSHTAILAGLIMACNPFQIWYSQEIRMYSMASALSAFVLCGFVDYLRDRKQRDAWISSVSLSALLMTQYYGFLLLSSLAVLTAVWLVRDASLRKKPLDLFLIVGLPLIVFSPWIPTLWLDFTQANHSGGFPSYFHPIKSLIFIFLKFSSFGNEAFIQHHPVLISSAALIFMILILRAVISLRDVQWVLPSSILIPVGLVFVACMSGVNMYKPHPFIMFHSSFIVLTAIGIRRFRMPLSGLLLLGVLVAHLMVLLRLNFGDTYVKPRVKEIAARIDSESSAADRVAVLPAFLPNPSPIVGDLLAYRYYSRRGDVVYLTGDNADDIIEVLESAFPQGHRLFLVYQLNPQVMDQIESIRAHLAESYMRVDREQFPSKIRGFSMGFDVYEARHADRSDPYGYSE